MPTLAFRATRPRRAIALTSLPFLGFLGVALASGDARAQVTFGGSAGGGSAGASASSPPPPAPVSATSSGAASSTVAEAPPAETGRAEAPAEDAESAEAREWKERDRQLGETATLTGGVGLLHMQHAQAGVPGQFRLGFTTEYFSAGFLCTSDFPCQNPRAAGKVTSDSLDHIGGTLTLSATITKWLEAYAGTGAFANSDNQNKPSLLQVLGDTDFGVKGYGKLGKFLHLGIAAELWLVNGTGSVGLDGGGTSAKFRGLATADFRDLKKPIPLRFSVNGTYVVDNTGDVVTATEAARHTSITRIERFGLQVNRVDHFDVGVGLEALVANERVRPFVEYNIAIPINRQSYLCRTTNISGDNCLAIDPIAPSKLTFGGRFLPWKNGFSLTTALDVGVTGVGDFIEEMAPQAPWTLYIGAGWAIDTVDRPPVEHTKIVEKTVETRAPGGHVKGFVHEKDRQDAVVNAIVSFDGHPEITSLATGADGRFTTQELPEGIWGFTVRAEGYKEGKCSATLTRAPAPTSSGANETASTGAKPPQPAPTGTGTGGTVNDAQIDCPLEALPRVGRVIGHVRDIESNAPVTTATVKLTDGANHELSVNADASGTFRFEGVSPGTATLTADADGYMTQVLPTEVKSRVDNNADISMRHRPKNPDVQVTAKEITIKKQIQFATDSAVILPESTALLTEIADVFIRNPRIRRTEVQGHTDSEGPDEHNQILSEDRANAVRSWLVQHGVAADRLTAKGYGEKKPLVPNVTAQNRARNRRVQFIILEQDAASGAAPTATPTAAPAKTPPALPSLATPNAPKAPPPPAPKPKVDQGF